MNKDLLALKEQLQAEEARKREQENAVKKAREQALDDAEDFSAAVSDVTPLEHNSVNLHQPNTEPTLAQEAKRKAATGESAPVDPNYLSTEFIELLQPNDWMEYKRDGVQEGVYKKLRLGKYTLEDAIDLHRRTVKQARDDVFFFIKSSLKRDYRTVLITHGKGESSTPQAVIKSHVYHWLVQHEDVIAFHSAKPHHGGVGAVYVLLRKSADAKFSNREFFNKMG